MKFQKINLYQMFYKFNNNKMILNPNYYWMNKKGVKISRSMSSNKEIKWMLKFKPRFKVKRRQRLLSYSKLQLYVNWDKMRRRLSWKMIYKFKKYNWVNWKLSKILILKSKSTLSLSNSNKTTSFNWKMSFKNAYKVNLKQKSF